MAKSKAQPKLAVAARPAAPGWSCLERVGSGASAEVWRATDARGRAAAIKIAKPEMADVVRAEARMLRDASRRWGARLLDEGETSSGEFFFASEWLEGEKLDPPSIPAKDRTRVAAVVAHAVGRALAELHDAGLRHGDVKPDNIVMHAAPRHDRARDRGASLIDLGLATRHELGARGGTARYASPELRENPEGVGPASDAFALGLVLEEVLDGEAGEPASWAKLLTQTSPGARPSPSWLASRAARFLGLEPDAAEAIEERRARARRSARVIRRSHETAENRVIDAGSTWTPIERARFWVTLVGPSAASWPEIDLEGDPLARALVLAERGPFEALALEDLRASDTAASPFLLPENPTERAILYALELAKPRPDSRLVSAAEDDAVAGRAPLAIALSLSDALVRAGELARASFVLSKHEEATADARRADIARRSGDAETAEKWARRVLSHGEGVAVDRAKATLGRLAWDAGDHEEAARLTRDARGAAAAETRALAALSAGAIAEGLAELRRVEASTPDELARLEGARGMLEHARGDARASARAFERAAELATQAGSVVEEATYLTGVAAASTDDGDLARALPAALRAALLWERLGRDASAARAWLARASALSTLGATHLADEAALEASARANASGDFRARAFARWARVETREPGDAIALREAIAAAHDLETSSDEDRGRASARLLVWAPSAIDETAIFKADRASSAWSAAARWEWWGMRARAVDAAAKPDDAKKILTAVAALVTTPAPLGAKGPALLSAKKLATQIGDGDAARRFEAERRATSNRLREGAPPALREHVETLAWTKNESSEGVELAPAQISELETIVRAFGGRDRLRPLFEQALDAMLLWSGVERGLLLLRAPDGKLVPRAARNLAREDLAGEQLVLSHGIAKEAMRRGEPVVATDAFATLGDLHASVHSLRLRSVLAVPLAARGETLGVVYLDDRTRRAAFGPRELAWVKLVASQAAMAIADARDQVLLRRAARRAERARKELAEILSHTEAKLDAALIELDSTRVDGATRYAYEAIVGRGKAMRAMLRVVDRVTSSEIPVLLKGESGTGKDLVARAIHTNGPRAKRAFVSENCASVPESLLESTLFGHVKGAFTGASVSRAGLFEVADGGTLFLDEIGEMSLTMQAKLLRVLQDGDVRPVGGDRTRKVDVRIIAATHRDLHAMVESGAFRQDLLFRLDVISIDVPALRDRPEDVPQLVSHFLAKHAPDRSMRVTRAALDRLTSFSWPGNVRQLENEIRRAIVLAPEDRIDVAELSAEIARGGADAAREAGKDLRSRVDALEKDMLQDALDKTGGNQTRAAHMLGLSRFGLQKMMKRLRVGAR